MQKNTPKVLVFQDEVTKISGEYSNSFKTYNLTDMALEIKNAGTCDLEVYGVIKITDSDGQPIPDEGNTWTQIALISASDFSVLSKVEADGIYYFSTAGCQKIRLKVNSLSSDAIVTMMEVF